MTGIGFERKDHGLFSHPWQEKVRKINAVPLVHHAECILVSGFQLILAIPHFQSFKIGCKVAPSEESEPGNILRNQHAQLIVLWFLTCKEIKIVKRGIIGEGITIKKQLVFFNDHVQPAP